MTRINKSIPYSTENPPTIEGKKSNKNSFTRFSSQINNVLESFWNLFRTPIKNKKKELNKENNVIFIEKYFTINNKYKKEIIHDEISTSIILRKKIERFKPNSHDSCTSTHLDHIYECDGFTFDRDLSDKFNKDFNRMNIYLHTPYRQENSVEIKDARVITAKFGLINAQLISQIMHQGFLAEPTFSLHQINKNEHYNIGEGAVKKTENNNSTEDMRTSFIIKETKNGDCTITVNKNFEYINTSNYFGNALPGLSISIERKTYLTKSNDGILQLKNHSGISKYINDNKDELKITIKKIT